MPPAEYASSKETIKKNKHSHTQEKYCGDGNVSEIGKSSCFPPQHINKPLK